MNGLDEARRLLDMAQKDFLALKSMTNAELFVEEIFGFHAQQSIEKALKAWLTLIPCEYPRTHDLSLLLYLLEEKGETPAPFLDLLEFTAFAVQFRYEAYDSEDEPLDRPAVLRHIAELIQHVEKLLNRNRQERNP